MKTGTINIDKVKKYISRVICRSNEKSYVDSIDLNNDKLQVVIQGRIDFIALSEISEEMDDKNMNISPLYNDSLIISFDVNNSKYRNYELPKLDLPTYDEIQDKLIGIKDYKFEEVFENNRYNYLYTYNDEKIKEFAATDYNKQIRTFYCIAQPDKPNTSKIYPPYLVCKAFIYYNDYKRNKEQSSVILNVEILDKKMKTRYERWMGSSISCQKNVFPSKHSYMFAEMFGHKDNRKVIRNLNNSIMYFDTIEEAQNMCNKINEFYNKFCLKQGWYV